MVLRILDLIIQGIEACAQRVHDLWHYLAIEIFVHNTHRLFVVVWNGFGSVEKAQAIQLPRSEQPNFSEESLNEW